MVNPDDPDPEVVSAIRFDPILQSPLSVSLVKVRAGLEAEPSASCKTLPVPTVNEPVILALPITSSEALGEVVPMPILPKTDNPKPGKAGAVEPV